MENATSAPITNGFHLLIDALTLNGFDTMYGVAGIPVTDLARLAQAEGIRYIGFRHEQSAGNAAAIAGYLTRKPGLCLTVSAPGFLNGMVALANATTNGFPMIQISGSSERSIIDLQQGDYEELDQLNAAKPYTKAAYRINKPGHRDWRCARDSCCAVGAARWRVPGSARGSPRLRAGRGGGEKLARASRGRGASANSRP